MGNRAVIAFKSEHIAKEDSPAIYLHWNGGRDSVEAYLAAAKILGIRWNDPTYCIARLTQIIGNSFGGYLSLGVGCFKNLDTNNYDNGVYWIADGEIVEREFFEGKEQNQHNYDEFVAEIVKDNKKHFCIDEE